MHEIGAFEAKNKFGQLLDWVEAGEDVVITRRGKVVARMVAPGMKADGRAVGLQPDAAKALIERIRLLRESASLGGLSVREMIDEGRK